MLPIYSVEAQQSPAPMVSQPAGVSPDANEGGRSDSTSVEGSNDADPFEHETIIVTGAKQPPRDVLGNISVLDQDEMTHDMRPGLGDLLADMPGVSASSFGPSSSRPILRGQQGERAPVLVDGISSLDLSASDPDHAVTINPLTAQRIEVLHGPAALLYGSSAIAGLVNVIDARIPRQEPKDIDVDLMLNYSTAANERSGNLGVDVPLGGHFVAHADVAYSKYGDLHIGGFLLSEPLRRQALVSPDPDIRALADLKDKLPNTAGRIDDLAG